MSHRYQNLIFTNHAYDRLKQRSINDEAIWETVNRPDKSIAKGKSTKFIKLIHERRIHVVANWLADKKQWLIISVWVRGEEDSTSLIWTLITLPFKIIWWMIKKLV